MLSGSGDENIQDKQKQKQKQKAEKYLNHLHNYKNENENENENDANKYIGNMIELNQYEEAYQFIISRDIDLENLNHNIWIQIGNYKFDNDEYEEALIMYDHIMDIIIINDILYINIAYCYQQLNKSKQALKYYYKYLEFNKFNNEDIYCIHNIAVLEYYNKNYDKALKMYNQMNKKHIIKNKLYFNIAVCYHHKQDYEKALNYFCKNLQFTNKNRDNCLISIAWIYSKKVKNFQKALETYKKINENIINNHNLEFDIAWAYQQIENYTQALKYYYKYLHKKSGNNNNLNTLHNIAWIYINDNNNNNNNNNAKAKQLLIKILQIDKNHFYANYTYGIYLRDIESNYELALSCLQIAHKIQANNTQIMIDIAKSYKYMNEFNCAKSYYLKAINMKYNDFYSNLEFAHYLAIIGDNKLSDFYYKKVLAIYKNNKNNKKDNCNLLIIHNINMVENYTNYGHVLHKLNKNMEAISVVKRAYLLAPNDCNTLNNLGYYNYIMGNYEESEKYLKLCLSINSNHEYTNSTYANLLYDQKQYDNACIYFEKAFTLKSDINDKDIAPKILYNYSMILYHHKKEYLKSLKYCKQFISMHMTQNTHNHNHDHDHDKLYYLMANIYIDIHKHNYAKKYLNKALKLNPQNNQYKALYNKLNKL